VKKRLLQHFSFEIFQLSYEGKRGSGYGSQIRYAGRVQARRSGHAKAIDRSLKAPKAKSVEQWLSAPKHYDVPTVDTNKPKKGDNWSV
jgi:hypothetical protein